MCNPPFYESAEQMLASAKAKQRPPLSACTGAEVEMVTPGGEVAFVSRMIQESLTLQGRVEWYTSMLGKLGSVSVIVEKLKRVGVSNWAMTEFVQGSKTRRWAVAWSWGDMRPRMVSCCPSGEPRFRLVKAHLHTRMSHEVSGVSRSICYRFHPNLCSLQQTCQSMSWHSALMGLSRI